MINYEEQAKFEEEVERHCNPDLSDEEIKANVDARIQEQKDYENELRGLLVRADELKDDPSWDYCGLCDCLTIKCDACGHASCSGGGCDECSEEDGGKFRIVIALSWATGGSFGEVDLPSWYLELKQRLEEEQERENCWECRVSFRNFAKAMIINRKETEPKVSDYFCLQHESRFAEDFLQQILEAESKVQQN